MTRILPRGTGYWDTTRADYSCNFARATEDVKVHLTGNRKPNRDVEFRIVPLLGLPIVGWTREDLLKETV